MLLETEEQLKNKLTKLEEILLSTLGNSTGNILENQVRNFTFDLNLSHFHEIWGRAYITFAFFLDFFTPPPPCNAIFLYL